MMNRTPSSQFALLRERRFAPFFWTQFLGAFNDNVFKTALLTVLTYETLSWTTLDPNALNNLIPGLFILPFLLFSATAGQLADKFDKARLARLVKLAEIAIMAIAGIGWMTHNLWLLVAAVAGMGLHSALFGPVKYAYLPQHLQTNELVGGNGMVEMGTFVGILLGEVLGAVLVLVKPWGIEMVAAGTLLIAITGWLTSRRIPASAPPAPNLRVSWNPFSEGLRNIRFSSGNRPVFLAMLGNSWFWFYGAIVLAQFPLFAKNELQGDHSVFVLLLTVFSVGIGAGSLLCERLSGRKLEIGLVPFGAIGLTLFGIDLYLSGTAYAASGPAAADAAAFLGSASAWRVVADCLLIGVFGGLYIVPLFALIQTRSDRTHLSRTIAGMNILNALFMVVAALVAMVLLKNGLTIPQLFLVTALLNAVVTACIFTAAPEYLAHFVAWLVIRTVRRVRVINADQLPAQGGAVLVCNRISHVDMLAFMAASPRPVRFVMDHGPVRYPLLARLLRSARSIPTAPEKGNPAIAHDAFDEIAAALRDHEIICLFAESGSTVFSQSGQLSANISRIVERTSVPVIPVTLRGPCTNMLTRPGTNPFGRFFRSGACSQLELSIGKQDSDSKGPSASMRAIIEATRDS